VRSQRFMNEVALKKWGFDRSLKNEDFNESFRKQNFDRTLISRNLDGSSKNDWLKYR